MFNVDSPARHKSFFSKTKNDITYSLSTILPEFCNCLYFDLDKNLKK